MRREEPRPEAEKLQQSLEKRRQCLATNQEASAIIEAQQQQIDHLLKIVSQQGLTIRRLQRQLEQLLEQFSQQPPKLKIESIQALYTILQEMIKRHTGVTFILGRIAFPQERVKTSHVRALLQDVQSLRLADHSTSETSNFLTRFIPRLAKLVEEFPSAETPIPIGLIDRVFTF